jgi:hypothetical protein
MTTPETNDDVQQRERQAWWDRYNDHNVRMSIRRAITKFVVREGRTLKVHRNYLPYVLALANEGLCNLGKFENGLQEIEPRKDSEL